MITPLPLPVRIPEETLDQFIARCLSKWIKAFTPVVERIQRMMEEITKDENAADNHAKTKRGHRLCHLPYHHVAIGFEHCTASVQAALRAGYNIIFH